MTTKHDDGKPRFSLLPVAALREIVAVLEYGAAKYGEDNWMTVPNGDRRYFDACMRHLMAYLDEEDNDPESGLPHIAHAACSLLFMLHLEAAKRLGEDE